jgi:hypothetical protein
MKKLYLAVLLLLNLTSIAQLKRIAVIGSSTAEGAGANPKDSSWVRRLSYHYKNTLGEIDTIHNIARPGANNYEGMPSSYTPPANRSSPDIERNITKALSFNPDVVIVSYVSNNYNLSGNPFPVTIEEVMISLQMIKDSANKAGKVCFITTTQPRTEFNAADRARLAVFKDSIINRFGFFAINFFDPIVDPVDNTLRAEFRVPSDNIHPNNAGHRVLFQQVLAKDILNAALPVEIRNFSGKLQNNQVQLQWTSYDEEPYTTYTIQRSGNGISFEALHQVDAQEGAGEKKYSFIDASPVGGANYYRLLIDQPSGKAFSKVIVVKNEEPGLVIQKLYPTRVSQTITLEIFSPKAQNTTIQIIGSNGARLKTFTRQLFRNKNIIHIPVGTLSTGNYFLRISNAEGGLYTLPFVK